MREGGVLGIADDVAQPAHRLADSAEPGLFGIRAGLPDNRRPGS